MDALTVADAPLPSTRVLDAAKGVLVALRRCSLSDAFSEILEVASQHEVGPLAVSEALLAMAEGGPDNHAGAAGEAAHRAWSPLLNR